MEIIYAGHSAVFFKVNDKTLVIDPWLNGNPLCPNNLKNPEKLDVIVLTHGHADHASEAADLAKKTGAQLIATYELAILMIEAGVDESKVIPMNKGGSVTIADFKVTLTHAMHSNSYDTPNGTRYAGEACGVVLQTSNTCIYHAGDTALFSDMQLIAQNYKPEIALLPIGDRFTMGPKEAAQAAKLLGVSKAIPVHYKTFPLLTGTAEEFESCVKDLNLDCQVLVLEPGKGVSLPS